MRLDFKSECRGYTLILEIDLLGTPVLYRRWYGLQNRRGGMKHQVFLNRNEALLEVERIKRLRVRHGYRLVSWGNLTETSK